MSYTLTRDYLCIC